MVEQPGLITPEIAERYGVSEHTVRKSWTQHPEWPDPKGKRGRFKEYGAEDVAAWVREHAQRETLELEPKRLYTAQQLEEAGIGVKAGTIRADLSRGRWPAPDDEEHGVKRWRGATVKAALAGRRAYRRSERVRVRVLSLVGEEAEVAADTPKRPESERYPAGEIALAAGVPREELPGVELTALVGSGDRLYGWRIE